MDFTTFLKHLIRRPRSYAPHGDLRQRQSEEVRTVLHGSQQVRTDRFEREADQVAERLAAESGPAAAARLAPSTTAPTRMPACFIRWSIPGTRSREPGTRNREPGTRNREPGPWHP